MTSCFFSSIMPSVLFKSLPVTDAFIWKKSQAVRPRMAQTPASVTLFLISAIVHTNRYFSVKSFLEYMYTISAVKILSVDPAAQEPALEI